MIRQYLSLLFIFITIVNAQQRANTQRRPVNTQQRAVTQSPAAAARACRRQCGCRPA